jgi:hypothetical protein
VLDRVRFTDFNLLSVFTANSRLAKVVSVKVSARQRVCALLCDTTKPPMNLNVHQDGERHRTGILETLGVGTINAKI